MSRVLLLLAAAAASTCASSGARRPAHGDAGLTLGDEVFVSSTPELARDVVTLAYRGILGREPDPGGLENYVQHLHDGERQRGIVWLCSILLESAEFRTAWPDALPTASAYLFGRLERGGGALGGRDLASQLHRGIEGCIDEGPVQATRRLLARGQGTLAGSSRQRLGLVASRAALLIARRTGACLGRGSVPPTRRHADFRRRCTSHPREPSPIWVYRTADASTATACVVPVALARLHHRRPASIRGKATSATVVNGRRGAVLGALHAVSARGDARYALSRRLARDRHRAARRRRWLMVPRCFRGGSSGAGLSSTRFRVCCVYCVCCVCVRRPGGWYAPWTAPSAQDARRAAACLADVLI